MSQDAHLEAQEPAHAFDKDTGDGQLICARDGCLSLFRPGGRGPYRKRFCSQACANAAWIAAHPRLGPRQKALPLEPPTEPLPKLNPTAPKERRTSLQRKALAILARLEQGSVDNLELPRIGGSRYGARLGEIREFLRWKHGRGPEWDPIECVENKATGWALYTLEVK